MQDLKKLILFLPFVIIACEQYNVPVYFPDYGLQEVREHSVVDRANIVISEQPVAVHPLSKIDGLICTDVVTFRKLKEDYLKGLKPVVFDLVYGQKALSSQQPSYPLNPQHF